MNEPSKRLICRTKDWSCNIPIDYAVEDENTVRAYRNKEIVGFFDLGAVDVLYVTEARQ